jgi:hypothetical protein
VADRKLVFSRFSARIIAVFIYSRTPKNQPFSLRATATGVKRPFCLVIDKC